MDGGGDVRVDMGVDVGVVREITKQKSLDFFINTLLY